MSAGSPPEAAAPGRVALVPSSYLPALGGVEELTRHLALAHLAAGWAVEVWTSVGDTEPPKTEELDGLTVRRVPMPLPAASARALAAFPGGSLRSLGRLRAAVKTFRPDVLHVQCFGPNGVYATAVAALLRVPLVLSLQGETVMDDDDIFERSAVLRRALSTSLARASVVTGCSRHTLADAEDRFGLAPGRGVVVPNGVVVDVAPAGVDAPRALGLPARPYVLALGRVVEKKGFDLLLRAYAALAPAERLADVVVAGEGPARVGLEALAARLGVGDRVHFVGRLSREEVAVAMARATAFVMPSRVEPFGIVLLEAWRAGVPVVATRHGGPPDIVTDGVDGVLVDPFDTPAFSRALGDLLSDDARRRRIGAAGRDRVGAFDWSLVAARYRELYAVALGGRMPAAADRP